MNEGVTVDDGNEDLGMDFTILWREYACCDPCMMTPGAQRLREKLLDRAYAAHARVKELESENARLLGLINATPAVKRMEYTPEDGISVELSHWAVRHIAASLLDSFKEAGGENFFTITVCPPVETDPDGIGPLEVTVRRCWKRKTPAMLIAELRAEIEALKAVRHMGGEGQ